MKHAWLVIALAGCGGGDGDDGVCSRGQGCEPGTVCDVTDPAGPTCIPTDEDLDGDGLLNGEDFCAHVEGGKFDEDRDGVGDDCDRCPISAAGPGADTDGDEVDSPCDPDPRTPGDRIVLFEGFNAGAIPAGWVASPAYAFGIGEVTVTASDLGFEELTTGLPLVSQQLAVFTQYRVDAVDDGASEVSAGIVARDVRPAGGERIACRGMRAGMMDRLLVESQTGADNRPFEDLFDSASLYQLTMALDRVTAACALVIDDSGGATLTSASGEVMSSAGLTARAVTAKFQYVMFVQRGQP
jgi:hypothetical protein